MEGNIMERDRHPFFASQGFYLHTCWNYRYPFAVRAWTRADYCSMFRLLRLLDIDKVMIWPMVEVAPPPLSETDASYYREFRNIVSEARETGLECWLAFTPNLSTTESIRSLPVKDRVFYPSMRTYRFDDPAELSRFLTHMRSHLSCLNNADGYVFIDGDPGGYPGARPREYLAMLEGIRKILDEVHDGDRPKLIHWVWCGWGADWEKDGCWKSDLTGLVGAMLDAIEATPPAEPWELLPGRSMTEQRANGRMTLDLAERAGLIGRSTLMLYEIIECEPTPPAFVNQLDDIRRVIRQEMKYASSAMGVFGNAQQPVTALHNLFYFARCARDAAWLDRQDAQVFAAFAEFLGGDAGVLGLALDIGRLRHDQVPPDLDARVRALDLKSEAALCIPGGPSLYLDILADFVRARIDVSDSVSKLPASGAEAMAKVEKAMSAIIKWWNRHKYVFSGEDGPDFQCRHTHWLLMKPLKEWLKTERRWFDDGAKADLAQCLVECGLVSRQVADKAVSVLMDGQ